MDKTALQTRFTVKLPEGWTTTELFTVVAPADPLTGFSPNVILESRPIDPGTDTKQFAESQEEGLRELTGYRELVFEPARVMGDREGYVRRFEFTPQGRESIAQTHLYYVEGSRAYTATATTLAASRRFDLQLHQILREVIIER